MLLAARAQGIEALLLNDEQPIWDAFIASVGRRQTQARLKSLIDRGLQKPGEIEKHLGQATTADYRK